MRKGLWSPDEDERLVRCITKYVNGSWSDIARKAGLDRCGKSCRRRWMNHLRPDLKRGRFSMEEIHLIVQLQEALGNRWSDIASHLEGRTDNDIKNLWNTQIKKKLAQLKTENNSSTDIPSPFEGNNQTTYGMSSTSNVRVPKQSIEMSSSEFLEECDDDLVMGFSSSVSGILDGSSCSASSCEGYATGECGYNQEKDSCHWKPDSNVSLELHRNPVYISFANTTHIDHDIHHREFAANGFDTESEAPDLRHWPCSSINLLTTSHFALQSDLILPVDNEDFGDTGAVTPTLLKSTTSSNYHFTALKTNSIGDAAGPQTLPIHESDECCSLLGSPNHSKVHSKQEIFPHLSKNQQITYMAKDHEGCHSNDLYTICNVVGKLECSPNLDKGSHSVRINASSVPTCMRSIAMNSSDNVMSGGSINYDLKDTLVGGRSCSGMRSTSGAAAAHCDHVVTASAKISDNIQLPLMVEGATVITNAGVDHMINSQQQSIINCVQGWDMVGETACSNNYMTVLPQTVSLPDWCKHILMQGDGLL
ncbi:hypothetical protein GOP47_0002708 [Adiantum capillus-veneris]|uniref:Uncharacterized protein n=1 Tax=Adiantum capillus-veneris TaxID=13818 RepID=A0A9D4VAK9_ADICA|nr:hypothetical protein GOP47_0002708 [Adiantum capillus-veneris]